MPQPRKKTRTIPSLVEFVDHYPLENPEGALEDVSRYLEYVGAFDGIRSNAL